MPLGYESEELPIVDEGQIKNYASDNTEEQDSGEEIEESENIDVVDGQ